MKTKIVITVALYALFSVIIFNACCKKKANIEKIRGIWVGAENTYGGYNGHTDTLFFDSDSTFLRKSSYSGYNNKKYSYFFKGDVMVINNVNISGTSITFEANDKIKWFTKKLVEDQIFYFSKQK